MTAPAHQIRLSQQGANSLALFCSCHPTPLAVRRSWVCWCFNDKYEDKNDACAFQTWLAWHEQQRRGSRDTGRAGSAVR